MAPSEMKNPVARPLWPEYSSPAPGRRIERRSAFFAFRAGRAALEGAAVCSGWIAGSVMVESANAYRSASGLHAIATRAGRDAAPSRSNLISACAVGAAASAAQSARTKTKLLVETPGDDEPEGIVPRERFRAHLEPDLRLVTDGRVALA